jgi:CHRD domain
MKASTQFSATLVATIAAVFAAPLFAHDNNNGRSVFATNLNGYQETPVTINSAGSGNFALRISKDGTSIQYQLSYKNLPSDVTQAHIHFGRPSLTGGVVLFLCTTLTPPAGVPVPPTCPPSPATVSGTLTMADVVAVTGQSIDAGATGFAEVLQAIRAGAAYANVHTTGHPSGEIRGSLGDDDDDY